MNLWSPPTPNSVGIIKLTVNLMEPWFSPSEVCRIWPAYKLQEAAEEASPLVSPSDVSHSLRKETRCSDAGKVSDLSSCCNTSFFSSLFLHLVGKRGRNSYSIPRSLCIFRNITILELMAAKVRYNQRGNRNSPMLCSALTDIADFCVSRQVPLPLFSHLCKVSNNNDLSPGMVGN